MSARMPFQTSAQVSSTADEPKLLLRDRASWSPASPTPEQWAWWASGAADADAGATEEQPGVCEPEEDRAPEAAAHSVSNIVNVLLNLSLGPAAAAAPAQQQVVFSPPCCTYSQANWVDRLSRASPAQASWDDLVFFDTNSGSLQPLMTEAGIHTPWPPSFMTEVVCKAWGDGDDARVAVFIDGELHEEDYRTALEDVDEGVATDKV